MTNFNHAFYSDLSEPNRRELFLAFWDLRKEGSATAFGAVSFDAQGYETCPEVIFGEFDTEMEGCRALVIAEIPEDGWNPRKFSAIVEYSENYKTIINAVRYFAIQFISKYDEQERRAVIKAALVFINRVIGSDPLFYLRPLPEEFRIRTGGTDWLTKEELKHFGFVKAPFTVENAMYFFAPKSGTQPAELWYCKKKKFVDDDGVEI
jgi:hypothetical protein